MLKQDRFLGLCTALNGKLIGNSSCSLGSDSELSFNKHASSLTLSKNKDSISLSGIEDVARETDTRFAYFNLSGAEIIFDLKEKRVEFESIRDSLKGSIHLE